VKLTKPKLRWIARWIEQTQGGQPKGCEFVYETWEALEADWHGRVLRWWEILIVSVECEQSGSPMGDLAMCLPDPNDPTEPAKHAPPALEVQS
jgi:hypothetical protein